MRNIKSITITPDPTGRLSIRKLTHSLDPMRADLRDDGSILLQPLTVQPADDAVSRQPTQEEDPRLYFEDGRLRAYLVGPDGAMEPNPWYVKP